MKVTVAQVRAARALLGWTADDLGRRARVHRHTVGKLEFSKATPQPKTLSRIVAALEAGGVEFTSGGGIQPKATFWSFQSP